eukprot:scpid74529/ scgid17025/ 
MLSLSTSSWAGLAWLTAVCAVFLGRGADSLVSEPMLFMDLTDVTKVEGRVRAVANSAVHLSAYSVPAENYTAGATVFAAFPILKNSSMQDRGGGDDGVSAYELGTGYEVFVAVGRPGEPWQQQEGERHDADRVRQAPGGGDFAADKNATAPFVDGVQVKRYTTEDFLKYSDPVVVLFLPNGELNDGKVWTVKSMDRNMASGEYVLFAAYGSSAHTFSNGPGNPPPTSENSLKPTTGSLSEGNFKDHDDTNIIYSSFSQGTSGAQWVDMQIMYENITVTMASTYPRKKYCDNISNSTRRVVTYRTSKDGITWSQDAGCADKPQKDEHCKTFDTENMIRPDTKTDPPELEFYRIRPFYLGDSKRLVAHTLLYVPSPPEVVAVPGYGRQPLWYCKSGCCHGPHMHEEWWIGPNDGDPTNLLEWRFPFYDTHAFPHDIWALSQPVVYNDSHIWVDNGAVWGLPLYRLAGLYTASNGEVITTAFQMPGTPVWINAQALWEGGNHVGGCDEGCAAYIM